MTDILLLRKRLCAEIAEQLELDFHLDRCEEWDQDQAALLIESILPSTRDESILEADAFTEAVHEVCSPAGPGPMARLREVLGYGKEISIRQVLEGAIERIKQR